MQIFHSIYTGQIFLSSQGLAFHFGGIEFLLCFNLGQFITVFSFMVFARLVICLKCLYLTQGFKDILACFLLEN